MDVEWQLCTTSLKLYVLMEILRKFKRNYTNTQHWNNTILFKLQTELLNLK